MKKKFFSAVLATAIITTFTGCNAEGNDTKDASKETIHDMHDGDNYKNDDGHQHDSTHKHDADTLGMKMGGNELDSKKK
jgi:hypothetical protein